MEPYPEFWTRLERIGKLGKGVSALLASEDDRLGEALATWFERFAAAAERLRVMAERQRRGESLANEDLELLNDMVRLEREKRDGGCRGEVTVEKLRGWLPELYYDVSGADRPRPCIADVHTDPNESQVFHVGTGLPRPLVVLVERGGTTSAFVGVVGTYYEEVTDDMTRLNDEDWVQHLPEREPPAWTDQGAN